MEDIFPLVPARTLGSAAQSMTQSTFGILARSAGRRMSPSTNLTPRVLSKGRFARLPSLKKLSKPQISILGRTDGNSRAKQEPTKPQAPVIRIFNALSRLGQFRKKCRRGSWSDPKRNSESAFWRDPRCSRYDPLHGFCRHKWRAFSCP